MLKSFLFGDVFLKICIKGLVWLLSTGAELTDCLKYFQEDLCKITPAHNITIQSTTISFLNMGCQTFEHRIIYGLQDVNRKIV